MPGWVTLDEFVNELNEDVEDASELSDAEAARLARVFDAAVEFVERIHLGRFNFTGQPSTLPVPGYTLKLGTVMLARRWHTRRRSPQMLVSAADMGAARVPWSDEDINRLLRLGKHAVPEVG
jgi:hypothetical protein